MNFSYMEVGLSRRKSEHIQIPTALLDNPVFRDVSLEAKVLYSRMYNRVFLSARNPERFSDREGRLYIYYSQSEVMELFRVSKNTAGKMMKQLENIGLAVWAAFCGNCTESAGAGIWGQRGNPPGPCRERGPQAFGQAVPGGRGIPQVYRKQRLLHGALPVRTAAGRGFLPVPASGGGQAGNPHGGANCRADQFRPAAAGGAGRAGNRAGIPQAAAPPPCPDAGAGFFFLHGAGKGRSARASKKQPTA